MADEMSRLESELKKGVNKRNALAAMGGTRGGKGRGKGKVQRKRQQRRKRTRAGY